MTLALARLSWACARGLCWGVWLMARTGCLKIHSARLAQLFEPAPAGFASYLVPG